MAVLTRRARRVGPSNRESTPAPSTMREVCLIGLDRRSPARRWPDGGVVEWLGRTYRVEANAQGYVHLAPAVGE